MTAPLRSHSSHLPHPLCHSLGEKYRSAGVGGSSPFMTANERETHSGAAFYFDTRKMRLMLSISHRCSVHFGPSGPMHLVSAPAARNLMRRLIRLPVALDTTGEPLWKSPSQHVDHEWHRHRREDPEAFQEMQTFLRALPKGPLTELSSHKKKAPIYVHPPF